MESFDPIGGWREWYRIPAGQRVVTDKTEDAECSPAYKLGLRRGCQRRAADGRDVQRHSASSRRCSARPRADRALSRREAPHLRHRPRPGVLGPRHGAGHRRADAGANYGFRSLIQEVVASEAFHRHDRQDGGLGGREQTTSQRRVIPLNPVSRRQCLRACGVALALPFLEGLLPAGRAAPRSPTQRGDAWWPSISAWVSCRAEFHPHEGRPRLRTDEVPRRPPGFPRPVHRDLRHVASRRGWRASRRAIVPDRRAASGQPELQEQRSRWTSSRPRRSGCRRALPVSC